MDKFKNKCYLRELETLSDEYKEYFKECYESIINEEIGKHHKNKNNLICVLSSIIKSHPDKDAKILLSEYLKSNNLDDKIKIKFGYDYYNDYKIKQSEHSKKVIKGEHSKWMRPNSKEYWLHKGMSDEESEYNVKKNNSNASIKRHKSYAKNEINYKELNPLCIEYWLKRNVNDPSKECEKYKNEKCNFSSGWFKIKYGDNWEFYKNEQNEIRKQSIIDKYGSLILSSGKKSNISINFFDALYSDIKKHLGDSITMYGGRYGDEFRYTDENTGNTYFYDFYIKEAKLLIEFNGIFWHARKKEEWKNTHINYYESLGNDKMKKEFIETKGYKLLYVWEDDNFDDKRREIVEYTKAIIYG
jgi:very-short-patch-repair endonuclease